MPAVAGDGAGDEPTRQQRAQNGQSEQRQEFQAQGAGVEFAPQMSSLAHGPGQQQGEEPPAQEGNEARRP